MRKLDGKIALVTGASKGIGAGIALSLAKEGAAVAVNYASDRKGADQMLDPRHLLRVHRNAIVNLDHVNEFSARTGKHVREVA